MTSKRLNDLALSAAYAAAPVDLRDKNLIARTIRAYVENSEWADEYIDQLNMLCEKHGCEPGADRLEWIDQKLSSLAPESPQDDRPGGFDGPTGAD